MQTSIIVQARMGSSRLPQKMNMPFHEGKSLLDVVLHRLQLAQQIISNKYGQSPNIIVATTQQEQDNTIAQIANNKGLTLYRGSENNVLQRFIEAATIYHTPKIIRVCADNPFLSIDALVALIEQSEAMNQTDYIAYFFDENQPAIKSHIGLFAEATTLACLQKIAQYTQKPLFQEHVTNYIYTNAQLFHIHRLAMPNIVQNRRDIRLTIDTIADFELQKTLYNTLLQQYGDFFSIQNIINTIDQSPEILHTMQQEIINNTK